MNNSQEYILDVNAEKTGIYLGQQLIDLLMIVNLKSKKELEHYFNNSCTQFPNKKIEDVISNFFLEEVNLENSKKTLFLAYQKSLINYLVNDQMTIQQQAELKINTMGLSEEDKSVLMTYINSGETNKAYDYLSKSKDQDFIIKFNRLMRDDFENIKSLSYEDVVNLNHKIVSDQSMDTIIIATGKYGNSVYADGSRKYFDPFLTFKGLQYCKLAGKHMRYHALIDYAHLTQTIKEGKTIENREEILSDLKIYIKETFEFINQHNDRMSDGSLRINVVEVFNELVEYHKDENDRDNYEMAWEKYFGITIEDLINCFDGLIKPEDVEFMYNETQLEECQKRLKEVEDVYAKIMIINPNFIDIFGNQMHLTHLHGEKKNTNSSIGIESVGETFDLMVKIQNGFDYIDKNGIVNKIPPKKIEITEFDIHIALQTMIEKVIPMIKNGQISETDIINMKRKWIKDISSLAREKGLKVDRATYWSLIDSIDHNLCRSNIAIQKFNKENNAGNPFLITMYGGLYGSNQYQKKIELTDELKKIFENIKTDSRFSSRELLEKYLKNEEFVQFTKTLEVKTKVLTDSIKEIREQNPQIDDEIFFQLVVSQKSKDIIEIIKNDYKELLTPEISDRLNKFKLTMINDIEKKGDITAFPELGEITINSANFATDKNQIEDKIVRALGTMPHELFHFVYRILKDENLCDERMVWNLTDGVKGTALGMAGHMLNEGVVEALSVEFCQRNNMYYTISPSYIQFAKLTNNIMSQNPNVDKNFLISNNYEGILELFTPEAQSLYRETERLEYANNFKIKLSTSDKRMINESEILSSNNEKINNTSIIEKTANENLVENSVTIQNEPFDQRSYSEIEIVAKIRNKNISILGTTWNPEIKSELEYKIEFEKILTNINTLEGIIHLYCYIQRSQMFEFGNKRLANLIANKEMIKNGFGIITVPVNKVNTYLTLLIEYYETNKLEKITNWIYENCIDGVEE